MKDLWNTIQIIFAAIGGWLGWFLGGFDGLLYALIIFVVVDYITGVMCAVVDKNLSSSVGFKGICRKVLIFAMVGIAHVLDANVIGDGSVLRTAVIFFYLSNEGVSLLENASHLGFLTMMNKLIFAHQMILKPLLHSLQGYDDKESLLQIQEYETKLEKNMEQRQVLTSLMASGLLEPALFNRENNMLIQEEQHLQEEKSKVIHSVSGDRTKVDALQKLIKAVSGEEMLTEYDDELFLAHVDHISVVSRDEIAFVMKCGLELKERVVR